MSRLPALVDSGTITVAIVYKQRQIRGLSRDDCRCGEMADAQDLKSWGLKKPCRFESDHRHHLWEAHFLEHNEIPAVAIRKAFTEEQILETRSARVHSP